MPCYSVSPAYRRNIVHVNPFYNPYHHAPQAVFQPRYSVPALFRSLEADLAQFDNFFREVDAGLKAVAREQKPFQPRFDIREESDKFILNGELPGVQPENLSIEFVDKNTMVIKGKVVRTESHGSPSSQASQPTGEQQVEPQQPASESEDVSMSGALPDTTSDTASVSSASNYQKASVEDEEGAENSASTSTPAEEQISKTTPEQPTQQEAVAKSVEQPQQSQSQSQYVVNERTVGSFSRAFRFPGKVNQDAVHAALKDGILTVSVPKYIEQDSRRKIEVQGA